MYGWSAQFDYTKAPLKIILGTADPRICSYDDVVFYNIAQTGFIDIQVDNCYESSDSTVKTDIQTIFSGLNTVKQLQGVTYFKKNNYNDIRQSGLIAQEVEKILPGAVHTDDSTGLKSIAYSSIIPYLIEAIKEQQDEIEDLKNKISYSSESTKKSLEMSSDETANLNSVKLFQNSPNPFNKETIIRCEIPEIKSGAMVNVYDLQGKQLYSYAVDKTGTVKISISASMFDAGIYIYSLILDGRFIDSKQMVLTN